MKSRAWPLLLAVLACACANWSKHGVDMTGKPPLRVALLPVRVTAPVKDPLRVAAEVSSALSDDLRESKDFEVAANVLYVSSAPYTPSRLQALGRELDAQVLLEVTVAGYGKLKSKNLLKHIGMSGLRGTVEGAIVAGPAGPVAGAVVLAYTMVKGVALWSSGTFLFNRIYSPVILDLNLYSAADGNKLWSDSALAVWNKEALEQLPEKRRGDREARLTLTAEKAAAKAIDYLLKEARQNLKAQRKKARKASPS